MSKITYPKTNTCDHVDEYFDTKVPDPYRWLEKNATDPEVDSWIKAQNKLSSDFFENIPFCSKLKDQMTKAWNYERLSAPITRGKYIYWFKNDGLQNQSVMYRRPADAPSAPEEVFLDPNTWSTDGTSSLTQVKFTEDYSLAAYSISHAGSDIRVCRIIDVETKKELESELTNLKFSGLSWIGNNGLLYSQYRDLDADADNALTNKTETHVVRYHKLGTSQLDDIDVFGAQPQQKRRYVSGTSDENDKYIIIDASIATSGNELYILPLTTGHELDTNVDPNLLKPIITGFDADYCYVDLYDDILYLTTNDETPNNKLISINLKKWLQNPIILNDAVNKHLILDDKSSNDIVTTLIPESDSVLEIETSGKYFIANYQRNALSEPIQYTYTGEKVRTITLPSPGTAYNFTAKRHEVSTYFTFLNYTTPETIYSLDLDSGVTTFYRSPKIDLPGLDCLKCVQVFIPSKDGKETIPMMISYHKDKLDLTTGKNPTILTGYGGFNISLQPYFSTSNALWIVNGGVLAVPNIRGGGEKGKRWHLAGTKLQKQNVFDDFISSAEYLIKNKYTTPDYLAIRGGSNGGLLVGACLTQRPDLFRVAIPQVGVLDMLRYHQFTAGKGWAVDYGTAEDNKEMFEYLYHYSPLHNVKNGIDYPATLVTSADHDDRVVPSHSFKFIAELQAKAKNCQQDHDATFDKKPCLIRIDCKAGHGAGKSTAAVIQEQAEIQSFILYCMGKEQI